MPKRDPVAEILETFDSFMAGGGILPALPDGKVNVTGLCTLLGLRKTDAQHFHKSEVLKGAVNALCEEQGLKKIGHRTQSEEDADANARLARVRQQATNDARAATEQVAVSEALLSELREAHQKIQDITLERDAFAARLDIFEAGGIPPRL